MSMHAPIPFADHNGVPLIDQDLPALTMAEVDALDRAADGRCPPMVHVVIRKMLANRGITATSPAPPRTP